MKGRKANPALWVVWAIAFLVYEFYSLRKHKDGHSPLTNTIIRYVPAELTYLGIGWLAIHFGLRYSKKTRLAAHRALAHGEVNVPSTDEAPKA